MPWGETPCTDLGLGAEAAPDAPTSGVTPALIHALLLGERQAPMSGTDPNTIFDDPADDEGETAADLAARAGIASGQCVPREDVVRWLESWGEPDERPCPMPPTA